MHRERLHLDEWASFLDEAVAEDDLGEAGQAVDGVDLSGLADHE